MIMCGLQELHGRIYAIAVAVFIIEFAYEVNDWMVDQSGDWGAPTTCGLDDNLIVLPGNLARLICRHVLGSSVCSSSSPATPTPATTRSPSRRSSA